MSNIGARPGVRLRHPEVDVSWQERANCLDADAEAFFPSEKVRITSGVRRICEGCPVRPDCLEHAMTHGEWFGVWGGLSVDERRQLERKRRKAGRQVSA